VAEHALSRGHNILFEEVEVLDRSQRYSPRLTREAIEIFKREYHQQKGRDHLVRSGGETNFAPDIVRADA